MTKIYIVSYHIPDYDTWDIYKYCSTKKKAQEKKQQLLDKIQNIKTTYYLEYDSDYDKDMDIYSNSMFEDNIPEELFDDIEDRVILYRAKHEELTFTDIKIEEKELL